MTTRTMEAGSADATPAMLGIALKEWAVTIRALREGRQVMILRKGGLLDRGGEFEVESRKVLLFPTYLHEDEQINSLQPCYGSWLREENARRPKEGTIRFDAWAQITDVENIRDPDALFRLASQHIFSDSFLRFRVENDARRPLYALFLRTYDLGRPVTMGLEPDHYGCRSWVEMGMAIPTEGSVPALSTYVYEERVRVTKRILSGEPAAKELVPA